MDTRKVTSSKLVLYSFLFLSALSLASASSDRFSVKDSLSHFKPQLQDKLNYTFMPNMSQKANVSSFGLAFLKGMQADKLFGINSTLCFKSLVGFYFDQITAYQIKTHYGDFDDILFNTTGLISNFSQSMMICTDATADIFVYLEKQFDQFDNVALYGMALFQHIVANIMNFNSIYQSMLTDTTITFNTTDVMYQMGKIVYIVIQVPPVQNSALQRLGARYTQQSPLEEVSVSETMFVSQQ